MKLSLLSFSLAATALALLPSPARADDAAVSVADGKFADHIEGGQPAGDAKGIAAAHKAIYWVDVANSGDATQVTVVWTVDGKEVQRQSLDVGHSPHWRTWGSRPIGNAKTVAVQVLDSAGKSLKEDSITLDAT
jgi:hypothetical protein